MQGIQRLMKAEILFFLRADIQTEPLMTSLKVLELSSNSTAE